MRVASGPMSATNESSDDGVAGPLAHLDRLVTVHQRDHLAELHLEAPGVDAQGLDAGLQAGHLAVVVGPEHVDDPVEPPHQELVAVIGQVAGEVGGVAVGLAQHPVTAVPQRSGPEPRGAVLLEDQALDRPAERWSRPPRRSPRWRPGCTTRRRRCPPRPGWPGCGRGSAPPPTARPSVTSSGPSYDRGQLGDVLPRVATLGHVTAAPSGQQALAQRPDLAAGVVHVVLAADLVARLGPGPGPGRRRSSPTSRCPHGSVRWGWPR